MGTSNNNQSGTESFGVPTQRMNCIVTVSENGFVIARFVYSDDAHRFAQASTELEPNRVLHVEDKGGYTNKTYGRTVNTES